MSIKPVKIPGVGMRNVKTALAAGITRQLNTASRVLLILLMYAGRLGSMTFMILLTRRKPPAPVQYPTDKILVG